MLEEALSAGYMPEQLFVAPTLLAKAGESGSTTPSERAEKLLRAFSKRGVTAVNLSAREMSRISTTTTAPGILAVFAAPSQVLSEQWTSSTRSILVCENIGDPGNLGTLIRSARAFDFRPVVLAGRCAEALSPKTVRSAMGALFSVPVIREGIGELLSMAREREGVLIAADSRGKAYFPEVMDQVGSRPIVLAVGSEADGLSQELTRAADHTVRIRHEEAVESLNAAVAGSILMNEVYNYRSGVRS